MKLTQFLLRRNRLPNGDIFRGKDRLVRKVEPRDIHKMAQNFEVEEKNMFYLRFPYLTEAESAGHAKELGTAEKRILNFKEVHRRRFKNDVTLYERLGHLRINESWDR